MRKFAIRMSLGSAGCLLLALAALGCARENERPNILVVVLDTVRRDAAGVVGARTPSALREDRLTPHLQRLQSQGVTFTRAYANAPWTVPSHASLFTGQLPSTHRCVSRRPRLDTAQTTAAEILRDAGYATAAFYSNPWLSRRSADLLQGFAIQTEAPIGTLNELRSRRGDQGGRETVDNIDRWLGERDDAQPFWLFVNFLESHLAYDPPPEYRRDHLRDLPVDDVVTLDWGHRFNAGLTPGAEVDWSRVQRLYAGDVWTADRLLGRVLALLDEHGLADDTVVIVTSDHGENLGEHGLIEHQFSVHETLLAVPLVVRVPPRWRERFAVGAPPAGRREDPVMLSDLFVTLQDLAGIAAPVGTRFSRSLFASPGPVERPVYAEYAGPPPNLIQFLRSLNPQLDVARLDRALATVRVGDLRLTIDDGESRELHDMATDPGQERNLADRQPEAVAVLLRLVLAANNPAPSDDSPVEIDEATRRKLESLGYIH